MDKPDYKKILEKQREAEKTIKGFCPQIDHSSGIYFLIRREENANNIYIGKGVDLLRRMVQHYLGYSQRIDISLKNRGFKSFDNPNGWELFFLKYPKEDLDKWERHFIEKYQSAGWVLYNVESGGTDGKTIIGERKPPKSYREGLVQGRKTLARELSHIIDTHLEIKLRKDTKISQKALAKFWELLNIKNEDNEK